jgi:hypothetical protein
MVRIVAGVDRATCLVCDLGKLIHHETLPGSEFCRDWSLALVAEYNLHTKILVHYDLHLSGIWQGFEH